MQMSGFSQCNCYMPNWCVHSVADGLMQCKLIAGELTEESYIKWKGYEPTDIVRSLYKLGPEPTSELFILDGNRYSMLHDPEGDKADREAARYENEIVRKWD